MIRALRACLHRPDLRRIVGVVALVAFVLVLVLGAAHAGEKSDAGHDHCSVCVAAATVGASETFAAPQLVDLLALVSPLAPPEAALPRTCEPRRSHAPRGPPALA